MSTSLTETEALQALARAMGVHTAYADGLGRDVVPPLETLVAVCASLGAGISSPADAAEALQALEARRAQVVLPPVIVAWDGFLPGVVVDHQRPAGAELRLEGDGVAEFDVRHGEIPTTRPLPPGYHRLSVETAGRTETATVISAPTLAWRRPETHRSWGLGAHLAALRSSRSRSLGDLGDLEALCRWVAARGGDTVTVLPLLPTFNESPAEPSPYSPVSRLFWSELILDLGSAHARVPAPPSLDVTRADAEVRVALAGVPAPDPDTLDPELVRYARFRGAQRRLGRNWRAWHQAARNGHLGPGDVDPDEERFHLVAQTLARRQLEELESRLDVMGIRLGLDLAVGVHPDGYDTWSRQGLFAGGMSVGAPPDPGFPSGQDWGFPPVLPGASRAEGHRYLAASLAHQAALSGVLRLDHIMALTRLYWIPDGAERTEGTYVDYPAEELFAVLTLESHRNRTEILGENLGTVPPEIDVALHRHRVWGMYLAQFAGGTTRVAPPRANDVAHFGTHDTPTFAGWVAQVDIDERIRSGLLDAADAPPEREAREASVARLAESLGGTPDDLGHLLREMLAWLGRSESPLVIPWLEDLWLESRQVNLPGTASWERPNWQRPMARLLDEALADADVEAVVGRLAEARAGRTGDAF